MRFRSPNPSGPKLKRHHICELTKARALKQHLHLEEREDKMGNTQTVVDDICLLLIRINERRRGIFNIDRCVGVGRYGRAT